MPSQDVNPAAEDVVETFAALVVETGCAHLNIGELLRAWNLADPGWAGTGAGRIRLADALERLEGVGLIRLPSRRGAQWDAALPRLPLRVAVPGNRKTPARALDPAIEPWVPALAWAGGFIRTARPPQRLRLALVAVNRWLAATMGQTPPVVSRDERSLEVFEDEKVLAALGGTALFRIDRLSLGLLSCEAPVGGIRVAVLANAGRVLVLENKAIFDSAWRALRGVLAAGQRPGYAALVFGGGDQAAGLVTDLLALAALVGVQATSFEYAGDVDIAGVSAAAMFIDAARARGLEAAPAQALWLALAAAPPAGEDLTGDSRERQAALAAAARLKLPGRVAERLGEGVRVPQERLTRMTLADTSWWG